MFCRCCNIKIEILNQHAKCTWGICTLSLILEAHKEISLNVQYEPEEQAMFYCFKKDVTNNEHHLRSLNQPFFCLSSGESGSGKTEACKHIVRHLAARSSPKGFTLEPRMKHVSLVLIQLPLQTVTGCLVGLNGFGIRDVTHSSEHES